MTVIGKTGIGEGEYKCNLHLKKRRKSAGGIWIVESSSQILASE